MPAFGHTRRVLVGPYDNTRYYLQEYAKLGLRPQSPEELYNLAHSSIWIIVEKALGI